MSKQIYFSYDENALSEMAKKVFSKEILNAYGAEELGLYLAKESKLTEIMMKGLSGVPLYPAPHPIAKGESVIVYLDNTYSLGLILQPVGVAEEYYQITRAVELSHGKAPEWDTDRYEYVNHQFVFADKKAALEDLKGRGMDTAEQADMVKEINRLARYL